ncbi:MAG: alpha/beta fold hydrolase [Bdellovibrionota bacterium]
MSLRCLRWTIVAALLVYGSLGFAAGFASAPETSEFYVSSASKDVSLFVRSVGKASDPTLILINGGPGLSSDYMRDLENLTSDHLRVVTFDQRGTGRSSRPKSLNFSLQKQVGDLEAIRAALVGANQPVVLLGHSFGGIIEMAYAIRHPNQVRKLIFLDSMAPDSVDEQTADQGFQNRIKALQAIGKIPAKLPSLEGNCSAYVLATLPAFFSNPDFPTPPALEATTCDPVAVAKTSDAISEYDVRPQLASLKIPVLTVFGKDDPRGLASTQAVLDAFASSPVKRLKVIDHCGHLWVECPGTTATAIREFLAQ